MSDGTSTSAVRAVVHTGTPGLFLVGQEGGEVLHLTVTNTGPHPLVLRSVRLTLPTGSGPGDLLAPGRTPELVQQGWDLGHDQRGGVLTLTPDHHRELGYDEPLTLALAGIEPSAPVGTVTLSAEVETDGPGGTSRTASQTTLVKTAESRMSDFRPSITHVDVKDPNRNKVVLTWKGKPRPRANGLRYWLYCGNEVHEVGDPGHKQNGRSIMDDQGNGRYEHAPKETTAYMLLAEWTEQQVKTTQGLTCAVTASNADLKVGSIRANGSVRLLGTPQAIRTITTPQNNKEAKTFKVPTDGTLAASIRSDHASTPAVVTVTVTLPKARSGAHGDGAPQAGEGEPRFYQATSENSGSPQSLTVPVPHGGSFRYVLSGTGKYTAQLTWYPTGQGRAVSL
ncbi:hypothetical protein [Nocardiopsis dassonvillei]|uniref:hypothetical protein n=1 Tax=Nocardiopsis dassonvillei TaxID=2014 RepID=UPI003670DE2A